MIVELFYPKELKRIIRDLEAAENLRREPLDILNREINFMVFCLVFLTLGGFYIDTIIESCFIFIITVLFSYTYVRSRINAFKSFTHGVKKYGVVTKIKNMTYNNTVIECARLSNGDKIKLGRVSFVVGAEHGVDIGKSISFYEINSNKKTALPDIDIVRKYYCLRKDLMEELSVERELAINSRGECVS